MMVVNTNVTLPLSEHVYSLFFVFQQAKHKPPVWKVHFIVYEPHIMSSQKNCCRLILNVNNFKKYSSLLIEYGKLQFCKVTFSKYSRKEKPSQTIVWMSSIL